MAHAAATAAGHAVPDPDHAGDGERRELLPILREHKQRRDAERAEAGELWKDHDFPGAGRWSAAHRQSQLKDASERMGAALWEDDD